MEFKLVERSVDLGVDDGPLGSLPKLPEAVEPLTAVAHQQS